MRYKWTAVPLLYERSHPPAALACFPRMILLLYFFYCCLILSCALLYYPGTISSLRGILYLVSFLDCDNGKRPCLVQSSAGRVYTDFHTKCNTEFGVGIGTLFFQCADTHTLYDTDT